MSEGSFLVDVARLREQARHEIERGPVTDSYGADLDRVIGVLQEALATELVCTLRYRQHHHTARGMNAEPIAAEFQVSLGQPPGVGHRAGQAGYQNRRRPGIADGRVRPPQPRRPCLVRRRPRHYAKTGIDAIEHRRLRRLEGKSRMRQVRALLPSGDALLAVFRARTVEGAGEEHDEDHAVEDDDERLQP